MDFDKLSRETQEWVRELEYGSSSIGNGIGDALEDVGSEEEFLVRATDSMVCLADETNGTLSRMRELLEKCRKQKGKTENVR